MSLSAPKRRRTSLSVSLVRNSRRTIWTTGLNAPNNRGSSESKTHKTLRIAGSMLGSPVALRQS